MSPAKLTARAREATVGQDEQCPVSMGKLRRVMPRARRRDSRWNRRAKACRVAGVNGDPIRDLEHDHRPIGRLLAALREALREAAPQAVEASRALAHGAAIDALAGLREEVLGHFAREEEGLFPLLLRELPALHGEVEAVRAQHDAVCTALEALGQAVLPGADRSAATASLAVFEQLYGAHAESELGLLARADERLDEAQRERLARALEGLLPRGSRRPLNRRAEGLRLANRRERAPPPPRAPPSCAARGARGSAGS